MSLKLTALPYTPIRVTSAFGWRKTGIAGASTNHKGVDLGTDKSKPYTSTDGGDVMAVLPGTVSISAYNATRGQYVKINHGTIAGVRVESLYQHLKRNSGISKGKAVKAGAVIGRMGNTGTGAQLHLHFELHINGVPIDPAPYLKKITETKVLEETEEDDLNEKEVRTLINKVLQGEGAVAPSLADELDKAKAAGLTDGTRPAGYMTRAEGAVMAYRSKPKRYQTLDEVPRIYQSVVKKLIKNGFKGTDKGLDLTEDMIRGIVIGGKYNG